MVLVHKRLNEFGLHQLVFQPTQHTVLYVFGMHGSVVGVGALLAPANSRLLWFLKKHEVRERSAPSRLKTATIFYLIVILKINDYLYAYKSTYKFGRHLTTNREYYGYVNYA